MLIAISWAAADFITSAPGEHPKGVAPQVESKQVIFLLFFGFFMRRLPMSVHTAPVGVSTGVGESTVWRCRPRRSCSSRNIGVRNIGFRSCHMDKLGLTGQALSV